MKTLIVYGTKYGTTEKAANILKERIPGQVDVVNLRENSQPSIQDYDVILVGSAVYGGGVRKEVRRFFDHRKDELFKKPFGLFLAAGNTLEVKRNYVVYVGKDVFDQAGIREHIGFGFDFNKMNFFEKVITKKVAKVNKNIESINHQGIENIIHWVCEVGGVEEPHSS